MPGMMLPTGEFALVVHPTDWMKYPFMLLDGRWHKMQHHNRPTSRNISEFTVREAIQNDGYIPVFFGLKIERPAPREATFTFDAPSTWSVSDIGIGDAVEANTQAWGRLNETIRDTNDTYQRQMEQYQRWINERFQGGVRSPGGSIPNENWYSERDGSFGQATVIANPHGDDTTRRYPTSEQITSRRRR